MPARTYRLILVGCVLSWFLVGLHLPGLHRFTHTGHAAPWTVLGATLLLAGAGVAGLWALLRAPSRGLRDGRGR